MQICDGTGNLCSDFLQRLEHLKREQSENLRELERLKIDAYLEGRNVETAQEDIYAAAGDVDKTITEMWMDFNLSERLNQVQLPADIHVASDRKSASKLKESWTPKVTVPEPFSMTVREENNPRPPKHTRASLEIEAARIKREEIESTINRNFKSRPVPAETYYPLYHDILLQSESRRKLVLESRRRELERIQNPPSFVERDERKKREKAQQIRMAKDEEERLIGLLSNSFKARDADYEILHTSQDIDEEQRQSRIRARSEHLLRTASLPSRMKSAPVRREYSQTESIAPRQRRSHAVPDFKKLHQENARKMQEAKSRAEEERNKRPKTAAPILQTNQRAQERPKGVSFDEPEVVFRASKIGFTPDSPPFKANDSFSRRKDFVRQTLDLLETQLHSEQDKIKERKKKERARGKIVRKSLQPKTNKINQVEKLRELQNEDRKRIEEYREMLDQIYNKVENERPLLFTQS